MSVLDRSSLEDSPLADLHALASELGIDGYRRLRKADLIDAILARQGGENGAGTVEDAAADAEAAERPRRGRRGRRGGRARRDADEGEGEAEAEAEAEGPVAKVADTEPAERVAEGVVELLGNGSGFLRVSPPDPSDDDVYISAAQVRRCELVSGDRVGGPVRPPRRSERYPSLIRVDTINGKAADEVAEGIHFDDLPAAFPTQRFALNSDDPTLKAIEWLTPLGRGSRAVIAGGPRAGKSEALRRIAAALAAQDGVDVTVVLAGVRPEEIGDWKEHGPGEPAVALSFAASHDAQSQAVERAVETAKRIASRGGDAVLVLDTLDGLHPHAARKILAAARDIVDGGSLTIIATASKPVGGETTVIALDAALTSTGRFPALDLGASGTLRPELLVGEAGADAIAQARAQALGVS
ncbi:MAG: transcription termination factor Rho [Actinobacteria bacterium]|nr:MAG: transcription termination factor Rho [Actinomycetota bacterium]